MSEDAELSRAISHALRHEPWLYELELDEEGWADLEILIDVLRQSRVGWEGLSPQDVQRMITGSGKRRHEISGNRIRAIYGHSIPGKLKKVAAGPPLMLYHGTSQNAAEEILRDGLKAMGRQYVHLSNDAEMAKKVGQRKSESPVVLKVSAGLAFANGVAFYWGNESVWLADYIPGHFVSK